MLSIEVVRNDGSTVTFSPPFLPCVLRRFPRLLIPRFGTRKLPLVARKAPRRR